MAKRFSKSYCCEIVLLCLLADDSVHQAADQGGVHRRTVRRWWDWE
jgi:transposase-like protein